MGRRSYAGDGIFNIKEDEISHVDITCYGGSNGSLAVIVHGGMPPYKYSIDGVNWQDEEYFDNLPIPQNPVKIIESQSELTYLVTNGTNIVVNLDNHYLSGKQKIYCKDTKNAIREVEVELKSPDELKWLLPNPLPSNTSMINGEYYVFLITDAGEDYATVPFEPFIYPIPSYYNSSIRTNRTIFLKTHTTGTKTYNFAARNTCGQISSIKFYMVISPRRLPNAVQDYDGNWYDAVIIGNQVWLGSNLKTTHYANGDQVSGISSVYDGYAYSWNNVMNGESASDENPSGVQGIAPNGWHIPSRAEFNELSSYVSSQEVYILGNNTSYIAKALCSTSGWKSDTTHQYGVGNNQSANNLTLLNIKPDESNGMGTSLWSSTTVGTTVVNIYYLALRSFAPDAVIGQEQNESKHPVRCVCDMDALTFIKWYWNTYGSFDHQLS